MNKLIKVFKDYNLSYINPNIAYIDVKSIRKFMIEDNKLFVFSDYDKEWYLFKNGMNIKDIEEIEEIIIQLGFDIMEINE